MPKTAKTGKKKTTKKVAAKKTAEVAKVATPKVRKGAVSKDYALARRTLERARQNYEFQRDHRDNAGLAAEFDELLTKLEILEGTVRAHGLSKAKRDAYDWETFKEEVQDFEQASYDIVVSAKQGQAERMATSCRLTDDELNEAFAEVKECTHPRDKVRALSNLVHTMRAAGGRDPMEEPRGPIQMGGNRRRRR